MIFLAVVSAYNVSGASATTLYFSNNGFTTEPGDTPADQYFEPRIKQAAALRRDMFGAGTSMGESTVGYGDLILLNPDGALDYMLGYAFDGRAITVYIGPDGGAWSTDFKVLLTSTMEQAEFSRTEVRLKIRDRQLALDVPLQGTLYAGSNSLPNGLEGVAGDLKGKPKPLLYGSCRNISPPCVNTSKLIYQLSDGAVSSISDVYDRGIELGAALPPDWTVATPDVYDGYTTFFGLFFSNSLQRWVMSNWVAFYESADGETWTRHWAPVVTGTVCGWHSIIEGRGILLATGDRGGIAYSPDAINWTLATSPFAVSDTCSRAAYSASLDLYVVGATGGQLYYSSDGASWTVAGTNPLSASADVNDIMWIEDFGLYVAVCANNEMATSPDGNIWTARTPSIPDPTLKAIGYSSYLGQAVVAGYTGYGANPPRCMTSTDGINWSTQSLPSVSTIYRVVWTPWRYWAMVGSTNKMFTSPDGVTWTAQDLATAWGAGTSVVGLDTDGSVVRACGSNQSVGSWTLGPNVVYTTQADLLDDTLAPPPSGYGVYLAGGYFRLGSTPAGIVTCNAIQGSAASDRTAAQVWKAALTAAGMTSSDWSASDITAADAANSAVIGYWSGTTPVNCSEVANLAAQSIGAWWGVDRTGIFRIAVFGDPNGETADFSFTADDMLKPLERITTNDPNHGLPIWRYTLRYDRNYTVQSNDIASGVTDAFRATLTHEWNEAYDSTASVKTAYLLAGDQLDETLLTTASDAGTEATRRLALRDSRRDRFEFSIPLDTTNYAVDLGKFVKLTHARFGLSAGKVFAVITVEPDAAARSIIIDCWG